MTDPSKWQIAPFEQYSSAIGNANASGLDLQMVYECTSVTYDESKNPFNPQLRVEIRQAADFDSTIEAAIEAKDWLDKVVERHGDAR